MKDWDELSFSFCEPAPIHHSFPSCVRHGASVIEWKHYIYQNTRQCHPHQWHRIVSKNTTRQSTLYRTHHSHSFWSSHLACILNLCNTVSPLRDPPLNENFSPPNWTNTGGGYRRDLTKLRPPISAGMGIHEGPIMSLFMWTSKMEAYALSMLLSAIVHKSWQESSLCMQGLCRPFKLVDVSWHLVELCMLRLRLGMSLHR